MNIKDIEDPKDFIKEYWNQVRSYYACDDKYNRANWKAVDYRQKLFVELWDKKFRDTIQAIVMNNDNPVNYKQFMNFELI